MNSSLVLLFLTILTTLQATEVSWEKNSVLDSNSYNEIDKPGYSEADGTSPLSWFLIFPGTKWCGNGDNAENDEDLGKFEDTDRCCRTHDFCDDIIGGYETKYNLTNPVFYTRLNCDCDEAFHNCLKDVGSVPSKQVGNLYFTGLGTQCFREAYPIVKCTKYTHLPIKKCVEYEFDTNGEKIYQWFDVPNF